MCLFQSHHSVLQFLRRWFSRRVYFKRNIVNTLSLKNIIKNPFRILLSFVFKARCRRIIRNNLNHFDLVQSCVSKTNQILLLWELFFKIFEVYHNKISCEKKKKLTKTNLNESWPNVNIPNWVLLRGSCFCANIIICIIYKIKTEHRPLKE